MATKVATTLTIDTEIKMMFKIECVKNEVEMSETVEGMMRDYITISKKMWNERNNKNG